MKSSIRTFVLAAFAAATILATAHSASAQIYSSNGSGDHQLGGGGTASVMVLALPSAGTYMLGGQQTFANTGNQSETVVLLGVDRERRHYGDTLRTRVLRNSNGRRVCHTSAQRFLHSHGADGYLGRLPQ